MSAPVSVSDLTRLWDREPAPIEPVPLACPPWCQIDHSVDLVDSTTSGRDHEVVLTPVATVSPDHVALVSVGSWDSFLDGTRSGPVVYVSCREGLDAAGARALAAALVRAARLVEDWGAR